jgi:sugar O-acyltransferase (sialic acid O-acetyltransferase NeuD family)
MRKKLIIFGAGGHARSCLNIIYNCKDYTIKGFVDDNTKVTSIDRYKVFRNIEIKKLKFKNMHGLVGVGHINTPATRIKLFKKMKYLNITPAKVISKNSIISKFSKVGFGTIVMDNVVVNAYAQIKENCIINTGCIIEHDVVIHSHCHISTGVIVNGGVTVGEGSFIGSGSIIRQGVNIKKNSFIPMGSVIKHDV